MLEAKNVVLQEGPGLTQLLAQMSAVCRKRKRDSNKVRRCLPCLYIVMASVTAHDHYTVFTSRACIAFTAEGSELLCSNRQCHIDAPISSDTLLQAINLLQHYNHFLPVC